MALMVLATTTSTTSWLSHSSSSSSSGSFSVCVQAQSLYDDPSSYFGGIDHDVYLQWVSETLQDDHQSSSMSSASSRYYSHSFFLSSAHDASRRVAVHYRVNSTEQILYLALAARAIGWFGFGLSENGGMLGADMMIYEAQHPTTLLDAHVLDDKYPLLDHCPSHWTFSIIVTNRCHQRWISIDSSCACL
jgi:hypothetical protein